MLLIKHAHVCTMKDGTKEILEDTDLLCDAGKIVAIGPNLSIENGEVIDASGLVVLPGLVDAHSHVGGFDMESNDQDLNEMTAPVTAELSARYGINFNSRAFRQIVQTGITTSAVTPGSANVVCGTVCAVKSAGKGYKDRIIKDPIALKGAMGLNPKGVYSAKNMRPMSRLGIAQVMREYFLQVKDYMKAKEEGVKNPDKMPKYDEAMEHGMLVLQHQIPFKVHSYQQDMLTVIEIAKEFDFEVTLDHALGASDFYDELTDEHVRGIIYGPVGSPLAGGELCKLDFYSVIELAKRGKRCAMMTDGPICNSDAIISETGEAVRYGMDPYDALRMITSWAAEIIGVEDRVGSIEVGKDADFAMFDGIPALDAAARCMITVIDGEVVYRR